MRLVLAGVLLAIAAAGVALAVLTGAESATADDGPLGWKGKPIAFTHPTLPTDHIVAGTIRHDGVGELRVVSRGDIQVRSRDGDKLVTSAVFSQTYGHGLFDPTRVPQGRLPERELMRIGNVGRFEPGTELPVTISWREEPGGPKGDRIYYPGGSLEIPAEKAAPAAPER